MAVVVESSISPRYRLTLLINSAAILFCSVVLIPKSLRSVRLTWFMKVSNFACRFGRSFNKPTTWSTISQIINPTETTVPNSTSVIEMAVRIFRSSIFVINGSITTARNAAKANGTTMSFASITAVMVSATTTNSLYV